MEMLLSFKSVEYNFSKPYCYKFNLNPDPNKSSDIPSLLKYCKKKGYGVWLVKCLSAKGYIHYHGMIHLCNINEERSDFAKKALYKQINAYSGRAYPLMTCDNIEAWYDYIMGASNFVQDDVFINAETKIKKKKYNLN